MRKKWHKKTIRAISVFIVSWIIINAFFRLYRIPTTSMVPTLMPGDYIFVNKVAYGFKVPFSHKRLFQMTQPKRSEVLVFRTPSQSKKVYVKRLIASDGEQVAIREGNIYINEKEVVEPVIARNYYYNQGDYGSQPQGIRVPDESYFFLGDNSIASADSRFWGFVNEGNIIGKAVFIWWPPARVNMVE